MEKQLKNAKNRNENFSKKMSTKIEIDQISGQPIEKRLKGKKQHLMDKMNEDRSNNKILNSMETNVKHWWINFNQKRGDQTILPHKFQVESLKLVDHKYYLLLNVSRKFVPIGSYYNQYFVAAGNYPGVSSTHSSSSNPSYSGTAGEAGEDDGPTQ